MNTDIKHKLLQLIAKHRSLGISEQLDYTKFYLYSIITHSTAIEGSTVTEVEAQLLFDEGITSSKRSITEQNMNLDLRDAYLYGIDWIKQHRPITVEWLISLSAKVMARTGSEYHCAGGDFDASKGEIRKLNVTAGLGGKSYMNYLKVPDKLKAFCQELNQRRNNIKTDDVAGVYELSFWAHYELVTIHPWADGNGRTSRLLMNLIQFEFGVLPSKVLKEDKAEYIQALIDTREKEDIEIFLNCISALHCQHLEEDIRSYEQSISNENVQKNVQKELSERQKDILFIIQEEPTITLSEMSKRMAISSKTIQRDMDILKTLGIVERTGGKTHGEWKVLR